MNVTDQLHRAIHAGLLPEVKRLVAEGAKMDMVLGMRGTALCAAIEARNLEITKFLINSGCDVNAQDFDGEPPLLLALRKDCPGQILGRKPSLDIAKLLIEDEKCNVNKYDPLTKKSALHFAVEQGMVDVTKWLLKAPCGCDVNAVDKNGNTSLHLAVHEGNPDVVQVLVANPKCLLKVYNNAGLTPLHICSNNGDNHSMNVIIGRLLGSSKDSLVYEQESGIVCESEMSINVNAVTIFGKETCLHIASRNAHVNIVKTLLNNGAKVDCLNNVNNTALLLSLCSSQQWQTMSNEIPKLLLKKGANPNIKARVNCRYFSPNMTVSPLHIAALNNNVELARLLVQHGADVNVTDRYGQTPLYTALVENSRPATEYLLLVPGMNVNCVTDGGETCLHAVMKYHDPKDVRVQVDMVRHLIEAGARLVQDNSGSSPIDAAFEHENHQALDALLEGTKTTGDELTVCGDSGASMLAVAVTNGSYDLVKVLLAHGADMNQRLPGLRNQSLLYAALYNEEYKIAEFFIENGCNIHGEEFIFREFESRTKCKGIISTADNAGDLDSDSDYSDSDYSDSDFSSDEYESDSFDVFRGNIKFKKLLQELASSPRSLQLLCLIDIRSYFLVNKVPFYMIDSLPLPERLRNKLRYR